MRRAWPQRARGRSGARLVAVPPRSVGQRTGFPGGPVYAITQTADGYLWIGAEKGLVRFDGLSFRLFEPRESRPGPVRPCSASWPIRTEACGRGCADRRWCGIATAPFENDSCRRWSPESVVTAMFRGARGRHSAVRARTRRRRPTATALPTIAGHRGRSRLVVHHCDGRDARRRGVARDARCRPCCGCRDREVTRDHTGACPI